MLLASAWKRLLVAGAAIAALWLAVLYVAPNTPFVAPEQPAMRPVAVAPSDAEAEVGPLTVLVRSGQEAPGGGSFDRFLVPSQDAAGPRLAQRVPFALLRSFSRALFLTTPFKLGAAGRAVE